MTVSTTLASDYVWSGGNSGSWADPANWTVGGEPASDYPKTSADNVKFSSGTVTTVDATGLGPSRVDINYLLVDANADVTITNVACLVFRGDGPWGSGQYNVSENATLRFRDCKHVILGKGQGSHIVLLHGQNAWFEVENCSLFQVADSAQLLPNSAHGGLRFINSTVEMQHVHLGYDGATRLSAEANETLIATNCTLTTPQILVYRSGDVLLHDTTLNCSDGISLQYLNKNDTAYTTPYFKFSGSTTVTLGAIAYARWYDKGEIYEFETARGSTDSPVVTVGSGGATFGGLDIAKISVSASEGWTEDYPSGTIVTLFASKDGGALRVPASWTNPSSGNVTLGEDVGSLNWNDADKRLTAVLSVPGQIKPVLEAASDPKMISATAARASFTLVSMGDGAETYGVTARLYSDPSRQTLVSSVNLGAGLSAVGCVYSAEFTGLSLGNTYYGTFEVANDQSQTAALDFSFDFDLPASQEDGNYVWIGYGDGTSWDDSLNWGVRSGYPSATSDTAAFGEGVVASVDLEKAALDLHLIYLGYQADVRIANGSIAFDEIVETLSDGKSGCNRLEFSAVALTRKNRGYHFCFGQYSDAPTYGTSYPYTYAPQSFLVLTGGSTLEVVGSDKIFIGGSDGGGFVFSNGMMTVSNFMPSEWGSKNVSFSLVGGKITGRSDGGRFRSKSTGGGFYMEDSEISGYSQDRADEYSQMQIVAKGITFVGSSTIALTVPENWPFLLNDQNTGLAMRATAGGFPSVSVTGGLRILASGKLHIESAEGADRPSHGVWTLFEATGGIDGLDAYEGPLSDCPQVVSDGFKHPARYKLTVNANRVTLTYPPAGMVLVVR